MTWRRAAGLMVCVAGCGGETVVASTASNGSSTESESGSNGPDLPPGPECPAGLGEVVTCECGFVDGCSMEIPESNTDCNWACDLPSPCPAVMCSYYDGGPSGCTVVEVAALECVFEALGEGQPMRWVTRYRHDYTFAYEDIVHEFLRLDATTYMRFHGRVMWLDSVPIERADELEFAAIEIPEQEWMACEAMAEDGARFGCLHGLAYGYSCPDPALLICP